MRRNSILSVINYWCAIAAGIVLLVGLAAVLYAVLVRSLFNQPATWAFDVTSYGLLFVVFLASPRTLERDGHVRIDFLLSRLHGQPKRWVEVLMQALGLVFLLLLLWATSWKTFESIAGEWVSPSIYEFPLRYVYWIMPAGVALMVLTAIVKLGAAVRHARGSATD
jgi:TRAP-type C4-dicarboxylate transport system permease small subunit